MRLIDADELTLVTVYTDYSLYSYYEQFDVDEAPTVDAVPIDFLEERKDMPVRVAIYEWEAQGGQAFASVDELEEE